MGGEARTDAVEQRDALRPVPRGHDHARGRAVEPGVVDEHRGDVVGVVVEVGRAPPARHHDDRREVAELGGERLVEDRLVAALALLALRSRPEHDRLVGAVRAGDVERVHEWVVREVPALSRVAVDHADQPGADERRERRLVDRGEVRHHGVHLEHDDLELHEQLVEHVERPDRRGVAGAEHEAHTRRRRGPVGRRHRARQLVRGQAAVHPHVGGRADVREPVREVDRHDAGDDAAVGQAARPAGDPRVPVTRDVADRVAHQAGAADEDVRPDDRLLGQFGGARVEPLVEGTRAPSSGPRRPASRAGPRRAGAPAPRPTPATQAAAFARTSVTAASSPASGVASGTGRRGENA